MAEGRSRPERSARGRPTRRRSPCRSPCTDAPRASSSPTSGSRRTSRSPWRSTAAPPCPSSSTGRSGDRRLAGVPDPGFDGVLETALYHDGGARAAIERFYREALGLPAVAGWPDGVAFRVGAGVLLLFDRDRLAERGGPIADHGTTGPGHVCLRAGGEAYARWRERLAAAGVEIVHDAEWGGGGRSFY